MTRAAFAIGICSIGLFAGSAMAQDVVSGDAGTLMPVADAIHGIEISQVARAYEIGR